MSATFSRFLVVTVLFIVCGPTYSQQVSTSIEPAGPLVNLSLIVVDSKDRTIELVEKDNIRVVENKVEQSILSVERDERPMDIVIAIDATGSFRDMLPYATIAAKLIIDRRRPADEVALLRFVSSDKIDMVQDFSKDNETLIKNLSLFRPQGGQSAIIDAVYVGAEHLAKYKTEENRRKALVVVTDGEDRNSFYKKEDLIKLLHEKGVQIFGLAITTKLDSDSGFIRASPRDKAEKFLKTIANETGGRAFFSKKPNDLGVATEEVIRSLHHSFLITFRSAIAGDKKTFRKVEVKTVPGENQRAIAPQGYLFRPSADVSNTKQ